MKLFQSRFMAVITAAFILASSFYLFGIKFTIAAENHATESAPAAGCAWALFPLKKAGPPSPYMVWLDLETTGLDHHNAHILEIAVVVTDNDLVEKGRFHRVLRIPKQVRQSLEPIILEMHTKSGLLAEVDQANLRPELVGEELLEFLKQFPSLVLHHGETGKPLPSIYLAGNSVEFDRKFLYFHMEKLTPYIHHQLTNISSLRLEMRRLYGVVADKTYPHRAMVDVESSIRELATYRAFLTGH